MRKLHCLLVWMLLLIGVYLHAQTTREVSGKIADPTGGHIPNAPVRIKSGATCYGIPDTRNVADKPYNANLKFYDHFKQVVQTGSTCNNTISISGCGERSVVDAERDYQGAGVAHVSGVATDLPTAMKELTNIPVDETVLNPPASGTSPILNPDY